MLAGSYAKNAENQINTQNNRLLKKKYKELDLLSNYLFKLIKRNRRLSYCYRQINADQ